MRCPQCRHYPVRIRRPQQRQHQDRERDAENGLRAAMGQRILESENEHRVGESGQQPCCCAHHREARSTRRIYLRQQHHAQHNDRYAAPLRPGRLLKPERKRQQVHKYRCAIHQRSGHGHTAFRNTGKVKREVAGYTQTGHDRPEPEFGIAQAIILSTDCQPQQHEHQADRTAIQRHHIGPPAFVHQDSAYSP